jgi:hypothetical protein
MKLFSTKVAQDKVELDGEIDASLNVVLTQKVSLEPLMIPVLNKLKSIIPGHFDDDAIDAAVKLLEAKFAEPAAAPAAAPAASS